MATKEKQIDLFEKAVGHPPHVLEIEEGQKSDFDLKAIKGIAAMGLDKEATPSESTEEVDHLCDKCDQYAQEWAVKAKELWNR